MLKDKNWLSFLLFIFNIFIININEVKAQAIEDCKIFYEAFDHFGKSKANFDVDTENCCNTHSMVTCKDNHITEIKIRNLDCYNRLSHEDMDAMISKFGELQYLTTFDLSYSTWCDDFFPKNISKLKNLKSLIMVKNTFTHVLPESISELTNLEILKLSNNKFFGEIPSSYGNLKNLKILLLDNNGLSEYVPYSFKNLKNLKTLNLNNNRKLKGYIPKDLKIEQCDYGGTKLCSLKSNTCNNNFERKCILADLQEINSSNGIPENDIKEYENEASSKSKDDSPVTIFIYSIFFIIGILAILYILICCCCGFGAISMLRSRKRNRSIDSNNKKGSSTNEDNAEILDKKPSEEVKIDFK
jgi:hypothetical protein